VPLRTLTALDEFADSAALLAVARERAGGITLAGSERMRHYMATVQAWADGRVEIAQVPSAQAFQREAGEWLQGLMADGRAGQRVLAVTSAGTISALVCAVLGLPPSRMADFMSGIHNAALTEIVFNRERCSLRHFNGAGHLDTGLLTLM
jgi:broad specificity phosphatase PhoE